MHNMYMMYGHTYIILFLLSKPLLAAFGFAGVLRLTAATSLFQI